MTPPGVSVCPFCEMYVVEKAGAITIEGMSTMMSTMMSPTY